MLNMFSIKCEASLCAQIELNRFSLMLTYQTYPHMFTSVTVTKQNAYLPSFLYAMWGWFKRNNLYFDV